jgi:hypothetical protein
MSRKKKEETIKIIQGKPVIGFNENMPIIEKKTSKKRKFLNIILFRKK